MRCVWKATIFFLVVIFIFLIYKLPAKFVYQQFSISSPIQLVGMSGSIWSGHVEQIQIQQLVLEKFDWHLSPWALLWGDVSVAWTLNDTAVNFAGELVLSPSQVSIKNTQGQIDLLVMAQHLPPQDFLLAGVINIDIHDLHIQQQKILNAEGDIRWYQAALLSPENIVFGDFNASLSNEAEHLVMQLTDTRGAVDLSGKIQLSIQGDVEYSMQVAIRDTSQPSLLEAFKQLGKPDEDGSVTLRGSGKLF